VKTESESDNSTEADSITEDQDKGVNALPRRQKIIKIVD